MLERFSAVKRPSRMLVSVLTRFIFGRGVMYEKLFLMASRVAGTYLAKRSLTQVVG